MSDQVTELLRIVDKSLDAAIFATVAEAMETLPQTTASQRMDFIRSIQQTADELARRCEFDLLKHVKGDRA